LLRGLSQNILSLGCVLDRYIRGTWGLTIGDVVRLARGSSEDEREAFDTFYHMLLSVLGWRSVLSTLAKGRLPATMRKKKT